MGKHELDETVEDILQHYGVKGMKWGVRRASNESASSQEGAGGGGGGDDEEEDEDLLEKIGDKLDKFADAMGKKIGDINKTLKKKGNNLLTKIFGKSETKYTLVKPGAKEMGGLKRNKKMEAMFKAMGEEVAREEALKRKNAKYTNPKRVAARKAVLNDKTLEKKLKSQGYKNVTRGKQITSKKRNKDGSVSVTTKSGGKYNISVSSDPKVAERKIAEYKKKGYKKIK